MNLVLENLKKKFLVENMKLTDQDNIIAIPTSPIMLIEHQDLEGWRSVFRIIFTTLAFVIPIVGFVFVYFKISETFEANLPKGIFSTLVVACLFFGSLFFSVGIVGRFFPWKKPFKVLRIMPNGTAEFVEVPNSHSIQKMLRQDSPQRKVISNISEYQDVLQNYMDSWQFHSDMDTQSWLENLKNDLKFKHEDDDGDYSIVQLLIDDRGVTLIFSIVLSTLTASRQSFETIDLQVLIVKNIQSVINK